jgi:hypothetical protein
VEVAGPLEEAAAEVAELNANPTRRLEG